MSNLLADNLKAFQNIWDGGYYEGDPMHPMGGSTYGTLGYLSVLHATWARCIKPYVRADTQALEIGPGRGAWTRTLLGAREVWAMDALSAEHNGFFEHVGQHRHLHYVQVSDFSCRELPEHHFDFVFSFGCLCHVPFEGISSYARNLRSKLRPGAQLFWMIADYEHRNAAIRRFGGDAFFQHLHPVTRRQPWRLWLARRLLRRNTPACLPPDTDATPRPGRWYDAGVERTCSMLRDTGYRILDPDVGTCLRDPIIHFTID